MAASEADHGQPERRGAEREKGDPVHALLPSTGGRAHRTRRLLRGELDVALVPVVEDGDGAHEQGGDADGRSL